MNWWLCLFFLIACLTLQAHTSAHMRNQKLIDKAALAALVTLLYCGWLNFWAKKRNPGMPEIRSVILAACTLATIGTYTAITTWGNV